MIRWLLIILMLIAGYTIFSQDNVLDKKTEKALKKEYQHKEKLVVEDKAKELTQIMVESHKFVVEANYVSDKIGKRYPVSSTLNFIIVDSTKGVLQLGSPSGANLATVEGRITKYEWEMKEKKNSVNYSVKIFIMTSYGTFDIYMSISELGHTEATVRGFSVNYSYSGNLVPLNASRVYKGSSLP